MDDARPTIGITMGDPCGVGAEVIVKALASRELRNRARFVIFGFYEQLAYTADTAEIDLGTVRVHHEDLRRLDLEMVAADYDEVAQPSSMPRGPSRLGGLASLAFLEDAIAAARTGVIDALVTAPISKTSWQMAGAKRFPGHTELLAERCGVRNVTMMFVSPQLKVALATTHHAVCDLRNLITIGAVFNPIDLADQALKRWFGIAKPKIAVAGLNPHAGEEGRFGDEESRIIAPAILLATEAGIDAIGPLPADTIFRQAVDGKFDCVVAMYHDQALIPIKLLAWDSAVNLTLGLPIIRTSPDHGTAFDIAGRNKANPASMIAAINLAIDLAGKKTK
ncbi:MAG: 4-hydroxythreonine-4-phosphate dehydrogenase PdxA [Planctomycetaceae bacterium]|nr:4-hydroxythreonine-4-phosphate dehydrogenase PdxA [Planctomycetaceae bacterium]